MWQKGQRSVAGYVMLWLSAWLWCCGQSREEAPRQRSPCHHHSPSHTDPLFLLFLPPLLASFCFKEVNNKWRENKRGLRAWLCCYVVRIWIIWRQATLKDVNNKGVEWRTITNKSGDKWAGMGGIEVWEENRKDTIWIKVKWIRSDNNTNYTPGQKH